MISIQRMQKTRGFSLLEVLVAVVILSVGLLALTSLQLATMRSSADAKAQTTALGIAQAQLESLRAYQSLAAYTALTDNNALTAVTVGGIAYTPSYTVTRYAYDTSAGPARYLQIDDTATDAAIAGSTCGNAVGGASATHTCVSNRDFKRIVVSVTWAQADSATGTVAVEDAIAAINPSDSAKTVKTASSNTTPRKAKVVIYNPGSTAGVIPIAIGTGTNTAATNPTPEVVGRGTSNERVTETRYNILTYGAISGGTATATNRVETAIAGCTCTRINNGTIVGYRPTYWDGDKYTTPELASWASTGAVTTGLAVPQSNLCTICCRDHHDNSSSATTRVASNQPKFDPYRTTHDHYVQTSDNNGNLVLTAAAVGENYAEACRLIRVNGIFRVAADTFNESLNLLGAKNDASTDEYVPTDAYKDLYAGTTSTTGLVKTYLNDRYVNNANYNTGPNATANSQANGIAGSTLHPTSISMEKSLAAYKWQHSRGLYIDFLEATVRTKINDYKTLCTSQGTTVCPDTTRQETILKMLPFTSINLSEVANWYTFNTANATDSSSDNLYVTMDDFLESLNYVQPVRGNVIIGINPNGNNLTPRVEPQIYRSNSGLALLPDAIDPSETSPAKDVQAFALTGANNSQFGGYYQLYIPKAAQNTAGYTYSTSTASYPTITSSPASRCTYQTKGSTKGKYLCVNYNLPIGSLTYPYITVNIKRYNYQDSSRTSTASLTCTSSADGVTTRAYPTNSLGAYSVNYCKNFKISALSTTASNALFGPLISTVLTPTVTNSGLVGEYSTFTLNKINSSTSANSSDVITVSLIPDDTPETISQSTCTYSESTVNAVTTYTYFVSPTPCP